MRSIWILIITAILIVIPLLACTCVGESTVKGELKANDLVVVGRVIDQEKVSIEDSTWLLGRDSVGRNRYFVFQKMHYRIVVTEKFKGEYTSDTLTIVTGLGGGDCGYRMIVGQSYIVYGYKRISERGNRKATNIYETSICSRTVSAADTLEIAELRRQSK